MRPEVYRKTDQGLEVSSANATAETTVIYELHSGDVGATAYGHALIRQAQAARDRETSQGQNASAPGSTSTDFTSEFLSVANKIHVPDITAESKHRMYWLAGQRSTGNDNTDLVLQLEGTDRITALRQLADRNRSNAQGDVLISGKEVAEEDLLRATRLRWYDLSRSAVVGEDTYSWDQLTRHLNSLRWQDIINGQ
jgi:hypothetical protein